MTDTRQALAALYKVVIARNRDGVDWGEHFGPLMTALADTKAALSAQPVAPAEPAAVGEPLTPRCACCGATKNLHRDLGSGGPFRCDSDDCVVF